MRPGNQAARGTIGMTVASMSPSLNSASEDQDVGQPGPRRPAVADLHCSAAALEPPAGLEKGGKAGQGGQSGLEVGQNDPGRLVCSVGYLGRLRPASALTVLALLAAGRFPHAARSWQSRQPALSKPPSRYCAVQGRAATTDLVVTAFFLARTPFPGCSRRSKQPSRQPGEDCIEGYVAPGKLEGRSMVLTP
jgi:hypothetical protein